MVKPSVRAAVALAFLLLGRGLSSGQSIAGVVKDVTGAVLPGVTVEATSPVLIEKLRLVATDDQGQYKIIDLRPGIYTVTFTLAGFNTVRREGVELTSSFTALVNVDMRVGGLEETITVSGASPVVDVQNTIQNHVLTREVIDAVPTGRSLQNMAVLVPGMVISGFGNTQDVGGSYGENNAQLQIHGGRTGDMVIMMDGMRFNNLAQTGNNGAQMSNDAVTEEVSVETGSVSIESSTGGVRVNMVPKEGSNVFRGTAFFNFTNHALQSANLTDELRAKGLQSTDHVDVNWRLTGSFGGPIRKDKLWFFVGHWNSLRTNIVAGNFYQQNPGSFQFAQDLTKPAFDNLWNVSDSVRLTWQATPKNKFNYYLDKTDRCVCHWFTNPLISPEASWIQNANETFLTQGTWSSPLTSRLLIEAGISFYHTIVTYGKQPEVDLTTTSVLDSGTGWRYRANSFYGPNPHLQEYGRASLAYVTGSHALKVGFNLQHGKTTQSTRPNNDQTFTFLNGVPVSVTYTGPRNDTEVLRADMGIYGQDKWTIRRATLTMALRWDYLNAEDPPQSIEAGLFIPARSFDAVKNVPNWKDLSPRFGIAYDLFGSGRTAIKASLSRYVGAEATVLAIANNPMIISTNTTTRSWRDVNGDFVPDGDPLNPLANGELGASGNPNFGKVVLTTRYDPKILNGWFVRPYNFETSAGVQHELLPRVSISGAFFRRHYGNFTTTDNLLRTPADYDPYCVTAPIDVRLPGGGGYQVCGMYDVTPEKFTATTDNLVTSVNNYGKQSEVYTGFDFTTSARLPNGVIVAGGLNTGRTDLNSCFVVDSPQATFAATSAAVGAVSGLSQDWCHVTTPFLTQVKALGSYTLPWHALQISGTYQSLPGPQLLGVWAAPNAAIAPSLNRPLAGNSATATVQLVKPGTMYGDRVNQLDFRVAKTFRLAGTTQLQAMVDLYNALNGSGAPGYNNTFGPQWLRPTSILQGRLVTFGAQANF